MNDGITTDPTPTARAALPAKLEYVLAREDYLAAWRYLAGTAASQLPPAVLQRLRNVIGAVILGIQALVILPPIFLLLFLVSPFAAFFCAATGVPATFVLAIPFNVALSGSPRLVGKFSLARPFRRPCGWGLAALAREQVRQGILDTASTFSFTMTAEGFTCTARHTLPGRSLDTVTTRQEWGPWTALTLVGADAEHVFLIAGIGRVVIVPRRAFAGERDFTAFAEVVRCCHAAAGLTPSPTGITAQAESIRQLPPPAPSEHVTR